MKKKDTCFVGVLVAVTSIIFVGFLVLPKQSVSLAERRKLADMPKLSLNALGDGSYMKDMEQFLLDHIPGRDLFKKTTVGVLKDVYRRIDVNGYIQVDQSIYKMEDDLQPKKIEHAINMFQGIVEKHFQNHATYYALIPDKNYFLNPKLSVPRFDYEKECAMLEAGLPQSQYIDLFDKLTIMDYYRTDLHWRQEKIMPVANYLLQEMENDSETVTQDEVLATDSFAGSYLLSSGYAVTPDTLYYLQNEILEQSSVYDYELQKDTTVYSLDIIGTGDDYDLYLGGARAILTLRNPQNTSGKSLIMFRDSFGSSIAPLLLPSYESITMIDLRYVPAEYALSMVDWDEQTDILFIYQATMLNHSDSFRQ